MCTQVLYILYIFLCARTPRAEEESDANRYIRRKICGSASTSYNITIGAYPNPYIRVRTKPGALVNQIDP